MPLRLRLAAITTTAALAAFTPTPTPAASAVASPWQLIWATHFATTPAPLGSFSRCTGTRQATCYGLPPVLRRQWWAFPDGGDTATQRHLPVGGYYTPQSDVWIAGGVMNIRLWRGSSYVHSAAVLPRAAMGRRYGRYVETFRVLHPQPGYKSAHLLWPVHQPTDGTAHEIDYPEAGWGTPIRAFVHFPTRRPWFGNSTLFGTAWHTTIIAWTPDGLWFYLDGHLIGHLSGRVADVPMRWVLQNETQTNGKWVPPRHSSATLQIRYAAYYAWN